MSWKEKKCVKEKIINVIKNEEKGTENEMVGTFKHFPFLKRPQEIVKNKKAHKKI